MKRPALAFLKRTALKVFKSWTALAREQNVRIDIHEIDRQAIQIVHARLVNGHAS